jgi:hypothetical protein
VTVDRSPPPKIELRKFLHRVNLGCPVVADLEALLTAARACSGWVES